jgi:hypothetical protein
MKRRLGRSLAFPENVIAFASLLELREGTELRRLSAITAPGQGFSWDPPPCQGAAQNGSRNALSHCASCPVAANHRRLTCFGCNPSIWAISAWEKPP